MNKPSISGANEPTVVGKPFNITFEQEWYKKGEIITGSEDIALEILSEPKRKWYHLLLQFITFGWYQASWSYKVRVV